MADDAGVTLARIEAMILQAEAGLRTVRVRMAREGRVPDPSNPFDPVGCLGLWLDALRERRDELRRRAGPSVAGRLH